MDGETKEEIVEKVFIEEDIQRLNRRKGEVIIKAEEEFKSGEIIMAFWQI